jgi:endonuclease/exonuclease/phosphatase family metal-dependent hydrolase
MDVGRYNSSIKCLKDSDTMKNVLSEICIGPINRISSSRISSSRILSSSISSSRISSRDNSSRDNSRFGVFEPEINFPPSYKFVGDTYSIVGSDKKRIPGYADRILFRRGKNQNLVKSNEDYQLITSATISDHKPVTCSFTITSLTHNKSNVRIITWNIGSGDNGKSASEMKDALDELVQSYQNDYIVLTLQEANDELYSVLKKEQKIGEYNIDGLSSALSSYSFFGKKIYYKLVTVVLKRNTVNVSSGGSPVIDNFKGILNGLKITKGKFGVNTKGAFNTTLHLGDGHKVHIVNLHFPFDNNITYNDFKTQLTALFSALDNGEWCIMAGDYNSRSNIILDENGNPIDAIKDSIFDQHKLKAIFGKGLQVHPISSVLKTKPTKFEVPDIDGHLKEYQNLCNELYKFYSSPTSTSLSSTSTSISSSSGGSKPRKTRKYKRIIIRKNKKHTNKYKKHKYILRKRSNKKRKY